MYINQRRTHEFFHKFFIFSPPPQIKKNFRLGKDFTPYDFQELLFLKFSQKCVKKCKFEAAYSTYEKLLHKIQIINYRPIYIVIEMTNSKMYTSLSLLIYIV